MKTALRIILVAIGMMALPLGMDAQSRAEQSLYGKTMKNFTVKSADKFLKKYPKSVYAPRITQMKDSILLAQFLEANTSKLTPQEAMAVAGEALCAVGWKHDGVERVLALDPGLSLRILSPDGTLVEQRSIPVYTMEEEGNDLQLVTPMEVIAPFGPKRNYVHFAYRIGNNEYVEALYQVQEDLAHQALFYGKSLGDGRIEGQSPEMMAGAQPSAEVSWLTGRLRENEALIPIAQADVLTDQAIDWWLKKNPKAETTASKLVFGRLDPESSIAQKCKDSAKEKGKSVRVAVFDIRGYTVICAVSTKDGEYTLVWCEPVCRNKKTDKYIRSYFFENDGTTLDVVYYKGNTTFKNKISLTGQTIRHLK